MSVPVSVVVVTMDEGPVLQRCVDSLRAEGLGAGVELVLVDNSAGQASRELDEVAATDGVRVVRPGANLGFAAGCNAGVAAAAGEVLVFLNPDTVVAAGAVAGLVSALERDPNCGIVMARLRLLDRPDRLNSGGNVVHVTGLAWSGGYGTPAARLHDTREVPYPSGAAMAIRREVFERVGGFTDEYFMYHEDLELGWKVRMAGMAVAVTPDADVYHDYEFSRNPRKLHYLERNRWIFLLTCFSLRYLVLACPLLAVTEVAMLLLAWRQGWLREKFDGYAWLASHGAWLRRQRGRVQGVRRVPDARLAPWLATRLDPAMVDVPGLTRVLNPLIDAYWAAMRRFL